MKNFKEIITRRLVELNKTAIWLCDECGFSQQNLQNIYSKNSTKPETLEKIAETLMLSPEVFFNTQTLVNEELAKYGFNREDVDLLVLKALQIVTEDNERLKNNQTFFEQG